MANGGVIPTEEGYPDYRLLVENCGRRVRRDRLAEFDRLMAEGGIDAVVKALAVQQGDNYG
jgi:hypothetical protein